MEHEDGLRRTRCRRRRDELLLRLLAMLLVQMLQMLLVADGIQMLRSRAVHAMRIFSPVTCRRRRRRRIDVVAVVRRRRRQTIAYHFQLSVDDIRQRRRFDCVDVIRFSFPSSSYSGVRPLDPASVVVVEVRRRADSPRRRPTKMSETAGAVVLGSHDDISWRRPRRRRERLDVLRTDAADGIGQAAASDSSRICLGRSRRPWTPSAATADRR